MNVVAACGRKFDEPGGVIDHKDQKRHHATYMFLVITLARPRTVPEPSKPASTSSHILAEAMELGRCSYLATTVIRD